MNEHLRTLMVEAHRIVQSAADEIADAAAPAPSYPPAEGAMLSDDEWAALARLCADDVGRAALRKVLREAAGSTIFQFLCLIDGVADPELRSPNGVWEGMDVIEPGSRPPPEDAWRPMLHDEFLDAYHEYEAALEER